MASTNHETGKSVVADELEQRGYSVQTEVDLPSTHDARVRADVVAERGGQTVAVEVGGMTDGKLDRIEPLVDRVVHVPYQTKNAIIGVDSDVYSVFKSVVRDVHGPKKAKREVHRMILAYLKYAPDDVVDHAIRQSNFTSLDELEAFVESEEPHRLTAEYVREELEDSL